MMKLILTVCKYTWLEDLVVFCILGCGKFMFFRWLWRWSRWERERESVCVCVRVCVCVKERERVNTTSVIFQWPDIKSITDALIFTGTAAFSAVARGFKTNLLMVFFFSDASSELSVFSSGDVNSAALALAVAQKGLERLVPTHRWD